MSSVEGKTSEMIRPDQLIVLFVASNIFHFTDFL